MPTSIASGTKTADGTEQDLATDTSNKIYRLVVDTAAMVDGETVELRIYTKCLTGGAERLAYMATYVNAQAEPMKYSMEVPADIHIRASLTQTAFVTAYKDFPWKLLSLNIDEIKAKTDNLPAAPANEVTLAKVLKYISNKMVVVDANGNFTIYDDDGVTPIVTGNIADDTVNTIRSAPGWV
jgi:hypothetical protein